VRRIALLIVLLTCKRYKLNQREQRFVRIPDKALFFKV